jgi:hypothetical protein
MVFLVLPVWILLVNIGYGAIRQAETQTALRLGSALYIDGLALKNRSQALSSAQTGVNDSVFDGDSAATLTANDQGSAPGGISGLVGNLLASASFRQKVEATVTRTPPYDVFPSTPIATSMIVSSNTYTFCEMKDKDFSGGDMNVINAIQIFGDAGLWLFGGVPGGDRCP